MFNLRLSFGMLFCNNTPLYTMLQRGVLFLLITNVVVLNINRAPKATTKTGLR